VDCVHRDDLRFLACSGLRAMKENQMNKL
jgi:hypothetical protein